MKRRLHAFVLLLPLLSPPAAAAEEASVDVSGRVTSGVDVLGFEHGEAVTRAKLKLKTKRQKKARMVLKVEATNLDRDLELEETYLDYKTGTDETIELGLAKKNFGIEYELGDDDRLSIHRTLLYRKLESFAFVGEETTLRWRRDANLENGQTGYQLGLGYGESLDANVFAGYSLPLSSEWLLSATALIQSDRINEERQLVFAGIASLLQMSQAARTEVELAFGQDPFESEVQKMFGDGKNRYFAGLKMLYGRRFALPDEAGVTPFVGGAYLCHDLSATSFHSVEAIFGVTYHFTENLELAANADLIGTSSRQKPAKRTFDESVVALEAKYVF